MRPSQALKRRNKTTARKLQEILKRMTGTNREILTLLMLDIICRYLIRCETIVIHNFFKAVLQTENMLAWYGTTAVGQKEKERDQCNVFNTHQ